MIKEERNYFKPIYILGDKKRIFSIDILPLLSEIEFEYVKKEIIKRCNACAINFSNVKPNNQPEEICNDEQIQAELENLEANINSEDEQEEGLDEENPLWDRVSQYWNDMLSKMSLYYYKDILCHEAAFSLCLKANYDQRKHLIALLNKPALLEDTYFLKKLEEIIPVQNNIKDFSYFINSIKFPCIRLFPNFLEGLITAYKNGKFTTVRNYLQYYLEFYEKTSPKIQGDMHVKHLICKWPQPFIAHKFLFTDPVLSKDKALVDLFFYKVTTVITDKKDKKIEAYPQDSLLTLTVNRELGRLGKRVRVLDDDKDLLFTLMHVNSNAKEEVFFNASIITYLFGKMLSDFNIRIGLVQLIELAKEKNEEKDFFDFLKFLISITSSEHLQNNPSLSLKIKELIFNSHSYQELYNYLENCPLLSMENNKYMKSLGECPQLKEAN